MTPCPDVEQLRRFINHELTASALSQFAVHLESCAICQEALDKLTTDSAVVLDVQATGASSYQPQSDGDLAGTLLAGRYKLIERIGEGGMGSVWSAQQREPVKRKVAVKLIKRGMESSQVLARFDAERQALAMMDHPNIAKVHDGGLHEGRPFFVMELVKGVPITEYCDTHRLTPHQRLELFVLVCQAIQHAHQKGIIHRDIKPSNVLIAMYDDRPVPKVIDFGVAKATTGTLTEATLDTGFGALIGTPQYMSPEQATFNNLDIDTRTDVYSLGVLLYELLSGSPPFTKQELEKKGLLEILRVVREDEPPKPSTKLSTADALPSLSANRGTEPKHLTGLLRQELDWIVMKALEKDRGRRYETANAFASDVSRYLCGEPVLAHPPSTSYRVKKFVRRNRPQVIAACLVLLALFAGIAGTAWQAHRAEKARVVAVENEKLAIAAADKERAARLDEERQRKFAQGINEFVRDDFFGLTSVEGQSRFGGKDKEELSRHSTLGQLLDRAAAKLRTRQDLDPLTEAELCWIIGMNYRSAGEPQKSIEFLDRAVRLRRAALGQEHEDTLRDMNFLALGYHAAGLLDRAVVQHEETLRLRKAKLGPDHRSALESMTNLAGAYHANGQLEKALPLFEEALKIKKEKLGENHSWTLTCMTNLASAYQDAGKSDLALSLSKTAFEAMKTKLGPDHPDTLTCMNNLAQLYRESKQLDLAIPLFVEALKLKTAKLGPDHPSTLTSQTNLAGAYLAAGQFDRAIPMYEESLQLKQAKLGVDHPLTLASRHNLALAHSTAGQPERAVPLYEETLKLRRAKIGVNHPDTLLTMDGLAKAYWRTKQLDKSIPLFEEAFKLKEARHGREHVATLLVAANLAVNYQDASRLDDAIPLFEEVHRASQKLPSLRWASPLLLTAYAKAGDDENFTKCLQQQLTEARQTLPPNSMQLASRLANLGEILLDQKKWTEAESLLRESLTISQSLEPAAWQTFSVTSMLGGALLGQKKYAEAEPLLLAGYEGLKRQETIVLRQNKARILEALDLLIEYTTATNKPAEAQRWQAERAKLGIP